MWPARAMDLAKIIQTNFGISLYDCFHCPVSEPAIAAIDSNNGWQGTTCNSWAADHTCEDCGQSIVETHVETR